MYPLGRSSTKPAGGMTKAGGKQDCQAYSTCICQPQPHHFAVEASQAPIQSILAKDKDGIVIFTLNEVGDDAGVGETSHVI